MALVATGHQQDVPDSKRRKYDIVPALAEELVPLPGSANRKSGLLAPTMLLTGHDAAVLALEFSPDGRHLASAGFDKQIYIWNTYGECDNFCVMKGHTNAVLEIHWNEDGTQIYSCSADMSCAVFDVASGKRIKKLSGHSAIVNSVHPSSRGSPLLSSASDDGTVKLWDMRIRRCVHTWEHQYQMLSVHFDEECNRIITGSLDNDIYVYDCRRKEEAPTMTLSGHADNVTGLSVSKSGHYLLSNSMDQSVRQWDIRPFVENENQRCVNVMGGATHNFEKNLLRVRWSHDDRYATSGSADRMVNIWDMKERKLVYKLPGHNGSVNECVFHPREPIIASCSSDKTIYLGELGE